MKCTALISNNVKVIFVLGAIFCCLNLRGQGTFDFDLDAENRSEVVSDAAPYRYICHLIVHRTYGGPYPSTGFFVDNDLILSAGHSLGERKGLFRNKIHKVRIKVFEYFENGTRHQTLIDTTIFRSGIDGIGKNPNYKGRKGNIEFDYGYLKLKKSFETIGDCFELVLYSDTIKDDDTIHITGYPGDKQTVKDGSLWDKSVKARRIDSEGNILKYDMYTYEGDSGAPIWVKKGNKYFVVGIHNTGFKTYNGGAKVTQTMLDFLKKVR
jgi:V8-like Glu-specific endopeptidase